MAIKRKKTWFCHVEQSPFGIQCSAHYPIESARRAESKLLIFTLRLFLNWAQTNGDLGCVYLAVVFLSSVAVLRIA